MVNLANLHGEFNNLNGEFISLERNMEMLVKIIQNLDEKFPKSDDEAQNEVGVHVEQPSFNKHIPRGFDSNNKGNKGWFQRGV